jgi:hypothetical protein
MAMWWLYVIIVALFAVGVLGFLSLVGVNVHRLTDKTTRTAESMYASYADSPRQQRRYAQKHGGEWRDESGRPGDIPR